MEAVATAGQTRKESLNSSLMSPVNLRRASPALVTKRADDGLHRR